MPVSCFFSRDNVAWAAVVLVVMLAGAAPCYGACFDKSLECTRILTKLTADIQGGGDRSTLCPPAVQSMTACVNAVKTECSGQQGIINSQEISLNSVKTLCAGHGGGGRVVPELAGLVSLLFLLPILKALL